MRHRITLSEDAATKREGLAVEILRAHFTRHGITIAPPLANRNWPAASSSCAPSFLPRATGWRITRRSFASLKHQGRSLAAVKTFLMANAKTTLVTMADVGGRSAIPMGSQHRASAGLRRYRSNSNSTSGARDTIEQRDPASGGAVTGENAGIAGTAHGHSRPPGSGANSTGGSHRTVGKSRCRPT